MNKELMLKVLGWVGVGILALAIFTSTNWSSFIVEMAGIFTVLGYAYGKVKSKVLVLSISVFFALIYAFVNVSLADFIWWTLAILLVI